MVGRSAPFVQSFRVMRYAYELNQTVSTGKGGMRQLPNPSLTLHTGKLLSTKCLARFTGERNQLVAELRRATEILLERSEHQSNFPLLTEYDLVYEVYPAKIVFYVLEFQVRDRWLVRQQFRDDELDVITQALQDANALHALDFML